MGNTNIQATFKKNKIAYFFAVVGAFLILISACLMVSQYAQDALHWKQFYSGSGLDVDRYIIERIFFFYFGCDVFFFFWFGVLCILIFLFLCFMMNRCSLIVSDARVIGKSSFGKQVDLPVKKISAIALGNFSSIAVATSAGKVSFWLIENREEIYSALCSLIENSDDTSSAAASVSSSIEELKKYKELLDSGVITQEDFDAKKKQLLGL